MSRLTRLPILGLVILVASASSVLAQNQYIGYVYPAGAQRGTTVSVRLGGQKLLYASDVVVTGEGVSARLVEYYRVMNNQELRLLRNQLKELRKKGATVSDAMADKMALYELPGRVEPPEVRGVVCPACGRLNPVGATVCSHCHANLPQPKRPKPPAKKAKKGGPPSAKEAARQKLIERLQRVFAEDERQPAVRAHCELVFAEITVAPDAKPGRREIRVITKRGISNAIPFYIGQVPEVARRPMKTCKKPVLGKESLAQRKRPPEDEEVCVTLPCTTNGQIAAGEVNRYRFTATKGQRLVICVKARKLVPYVPDGVPGWFQAVLRLYDSSGKEVAFCDDFHSDPDPLLYYEVPKDDDYVLTINEALYRGRESFTYRITIGQVPYVTSIFPLGSRVGQPVKIELNGWNLDKATVAPPPKDARPGRHLIAATNGTFVSNDVPFALDTLPELMDKEPNNAPSKAQKVTLPVIVNGRADQPGDWDVFEVDGKAGETIVAEVRARRLGSPFDSFVKVTRADGTVIALNDDHFDAASGLNTDHADSYLMAKLPAAGKYFVHIGDTRRQAGKAFAYRLRISRPQPDFELCVIPSRIVLRSKASAALTVFAIRRDGFDGPIKLGFKNLPKGLEASGVTLAAKKETARLAVKAGAHYMEKPVNVTVVGSAKVGDREIVHEAAPAEDTMQAFLWRHLLPAEDLPVLVYNPAYRPPTDRLRPPIRDADRPKEAKRDLTKRSVDGYMRQIERLYQEWLITDVFANREIAGIEGRLIK